MCVCMYVGFGVRCRCLLLEHRALEDERILGGASLSNAIATPLEERRAARANKRLLDRCIHQSIVGVDFDTRRKICG